MFSYAQDSSFAGGSLGTAHAETILRVMQLAGRAGAPIVGFVESAGARMQEGLAALGGFVRIFQENVALSGRVPQISIVRSWAMRVHAGKRPSAKCRNPIPRSMKFGK